MGLRCLLGHEYGNREVEREREERGDEVVVTYRTVETCDRCGERRTVSENKEVRAVRSPEDVELDEGVTTGLGDDAGGVTPDSEEGQATDPTAPAAETDAPAGPSVDADPGLSVDADPGQTVTGNDDAAEDVTVDDADETPVDTPGDDGIILGDDDTADPARSHGEWPSADAEEKGGDDEATERLDEPVDDGTTVVSGGDAWPDHEDDDEGFDAEPVNADTEPESVTFGGGLMPEATDGDGGSGEGGAVANGTTATAAGKQFVSAETVERVDDTRHDVETEFFCPNCGHARGAGESSMRAGDICPECHGGYIAERER